MGHYAADMRPEWFEKPKPKPKAGKGKVITEGQDPTGDSLVDGVYVPAPETQKSLPHINSLPCQLSDMADMELRYTANMLQEVEQLNAAVDAFAMRMKARLEQKAKQGFSGWDKASPDLLRSLLLESVTKESTLDLGIYAMMLAHRGISMKQGNSNETA